MKSIRRRLRLLPAAATVLVQGCVMRAMAAEAAIQAEDFAGNTTGAQGAMFAVLGISFLLAGAAACLMSVRRH